MKLSNKNTVFFTCSGIVNNIITTSVVIIDIIGSQLRRLQVRRVDLYKLAEKCISLECLHLEVYEYIAVEYVEVLKKLPGLKSVKCLKLFATHPEVVAFFVSLCRKLEVLDVEFVNPDYDMTIFNAFINEPLTAPVWFRGKIVTSHAWARVRSPVGSISRLKFFLGFSPNHK